MVVATGLKNRKGARAPNDDRVGSADRTGFRVSSLAGQVSGPILHDSPSALEQVRPAIGRFDLVVHHMRERCLHDLSGMIRLFGRPVEVGAPRAAVPIQRLQAGHIAGGSDPAGNLGASGVDRLFSVWGAIERTGFG